MSSRMAEYADTMADMADRWFQAWRVPYDGADAILVVFRPDHGQGFVFERDHEDYDVYAKMADRQAAK